MFDTNSQSPREMFKEVIAFTLFATARYKTPAEAIEAADVIYTDVVDGTREVREEALDTLATLITLGEGASAIVDHAQAFDEEDDLVAPMTPEEEGVSFIEEDETLKGRSVDLPGLSVESVEKAIAQIFGLPQPTPQPQYHSGPFMFKLPDHLLRTAN